MYLRQSEHLTKPRGIIIHTDGQSGNNWSVWDSERTHDTLIERGIDVHFAVDTRGVSQYLKMYKDVVTPTRGAIGFSNYLSIEMSGRNYDEIFDLSIEAEKREVIKKITERTILLVMKLMDTYGIGIENVLGHYAASASGKSDPGQRYMEEYFMPALLSVYKARPFKPSKRETK